MAVEQTTHTRVVCGGDEATLRAEAVEDPCLDCVIGQRRAMHIEMGRTEVRDHDGIAGDSRQTVRREHAAGNFDDRVRTTIGLEPTEPVGEHHGPAEIGHHRLGIVGSQAAQIRQHTDP